MRERRERGAVSVAVFYSILTLLVILLTIFSAVYVKSKSQLAETQMLKDTYDMDQKEVDDEINSNITFDNNYLDKNVYTYATDTSHYTARTISATFTRSADANAEEGYIIKATIAGTATMDGIYHSDISTSNLIKGKTYTWSVILKGNKEKKLKIGNLSGGELVIDLKTSWTRYTKTFEATSNSDSNFEFFVNNDSWNTGDELDIRSLQLEEGDGSQDKTTQKTRNKKAFGTLTEPSRTDYTFNGWYNDPVEGAKISKDDMIPNEDTTYYAHWTKK